MDVTPIDCAIAAQRGWRLQIQRSPAGRLRLCVFVSNPAASADLWICPRGLASLVASTTRASVIGVNAWVMGGYDGRPDRSAVSENQFRFAIGFTDSAGSPTIYINHLSFGYTTSADGNLIASGSWPKAGSARRRAKKFPCAYGRLEGFDCNWNLAIFCG